MYPTRQTIIDYHGLVISLKNLSERPEVMLLSLELCVILMFLTEAVMFMLLNHHLGCFFMPDRLGLCRFSQCFQDLVLS